ncbi:hypothetical protein C5167_041845 [Papaver somniferum]|nr:hypothetical protein C5167_041845 [Papaver somniferum]
MEVHDRKYEKVGTGGGAFGIFRGLQAEMKRKTEPEEAETKSQLRILLILSTYKLYLSTCGDGGDWEVHLSLLAIAEVFLKDGFVQGTFLNVS